AGWRGRASSCGDRGRTVSGGSWCGSSAGYFRRGSSVRSPEAGVGSARPRRCPRGASARRGREVGGVSGENARERLRHASPPQVALPDVPTSPVRFEDLPGRFAQSVTDVAGTCLRGPGLSEAAAAVRGLPVLQSARQIVSLVPEVVPGTVKLDAVADPHLLE